MLAPIPESAARERSRNLAVTLLRCVDPTRIPGWDDALQLQDGATVFHSAAWARVLHLSFGYRPMYVAAYRDERLIGVLPLMEVRSTLTGVRGISLPFSDWCGPLGHTPDIERAVHEEALRLGKTHGWRYVEFRNAWAGASAEPLPVASAYCEHMLDLSPGFTDVSTRFHSSVSESVRRARAAGMETTVDASLASLRTFDRLNAYSRTRNGLPTQPLAFLRHLHREVLEQGHGFIVTARRNGRPTAAAIFLHFRGDAVLKYGAPGRSSSDMRAYDLVIWEGIRRCAHVGIKQLFLGRTAAEDLDLRGRKRAWGTNENEFQYVRVDPRTGGKVTTIRDGAATLPARVLRMLPVPTARLAGRLLYRHFA